MQKFLAPAGFTIFLLAIDWYASGVWHPDRMGAKAVVNTIEHLSLLLGVQLSSGEKIEHGV